MASRSPSWSHTLLSLIFATTPVLPSLVINVAPTTPQPYILPNLAGAAVDFGGLIIRTVVPNDTSDGTLSLLMVNSGPGAAGLIHYHKEVEAFYTLKGSVQVWHNSDVGRQASANDFVLLAPGNNHTYRPNDLDFQLALCMAPGGIDEFFAQAGNPYSSNSPFDPLDNSKLNVPKVLSLMPKFNIIPNPRLPINVDWTNGTTADGLDTWHVANQTLPSSPGTAYFVSSNRGPKYLQRRSSTITAALTTGKQTNNKLSVATVSIPPSTRPRNSVSSPIHQAFMITEGALQLEINGEVNQLIFGDVAFIPNGTQFRYWSTVGFTKFVVWAGGNGGLADALIQDSENWGFAVWPIDRTSGEDEETLREQEKS